MVPAISSVGVHIEWLDQAPQFPQENRDAFLQDSCADPTPVTRLVRPPSTQAQVSLLAHPLPRNTVLLDDKTARGGPTRLVVGIRRQRPRRSWRCCCRWTRQALLLGYDMEVLRALNVCWRSELERVGVQDQALPKAELIKRQTHQSQAVTLPRLPLHLLSVSAFSRVVLPLPPGERYQCTPLVSWKVKSPSVADGELPFFSGHFAISTRTRPCGPRCFPSQQPRLPFHGTTPPSQQPQPGRGPLLPDTTSNTHKHTPMAVEDAWPVASWPPCRDRVDRPPISPETRHPTRTRGQTEPQTILQPLTLMTLRATFNEEMTRTKKGQLSKACSAVLDELSVPNPKQSPESCETVIHHLERRT